METETQKPGPTKGPPKRIQIKHCKIAASAQTLNGKDLAVAKFLAWVDSAVAREVDFYLKVNSSAPPFLGVTTSVLDAGIAQASLKLEVVTTLTSLPPLRLGARTLKREGTESVSEMWSLPLRPEEECECEITDEKIPVVTGNTDRSPPSRVPYHWLELFRFNRVGNVADFVDEHNLADDYGAGWHLVRAANQPRWQSAWTWAKYCVQIKNVSLKNVTTNNVPGGLDHQPYADYTSCNRGPISKLQSSLYVGKLHIHLPHLVPRFPLRPGYPEIDNTTNITAGWYSFPQRTACRPGERLGEAGCTWRRKASYALARFADFKAHGLDGTTIETPLGQIHPAATTIHNADVVHRTFARGPLAVLPCGES